MKIFSASLLALAPALAIGCAHAPAAPTSSAAQPHWTYEGATGPEHWAEVDPKFTACRDGKRQSPIDLGGAAASAAPSSDLAPLQVRYAPLGAEFFDSGHALQLDFDGGALDFGGKRFALKQLHFHTPAEHTRDGKRAAVELHLVHQADDGALAVIAVQWELGDAHAGLAPLWEQLPERGGARRKLKAPFDPTTLLPDARGYFTYEGSLTAPPCSENVTWIVLRATATVSAEQLAALRARYDLNARQTQLPGARAVRVGN